MSTIVELNQAQRALPELIANLEVEDEVVITRENLPVAKLVLPAANSTLDRKAGFGKGLLKIVVDDDEHLNDFEEYMP